MTDHKMSSSLLGTVAIITARGGSKRIPRKNVREFCGKPIIAYSIEAALASECFDEVMVSTDDPEVARIASDYGAVVPFMRSARTATDYATTADVLLEVLHEYGRRDVYPQLACCLYPTAPLISPKVLQEARAILLACPAVPAVMPVAKFPYPIQRALRVSGGIISLFDPSHLTTRSQDLEPAYHDAGQFYWLRVPHFLASRSLMAPGTAGLILSEEYVQDIDEETDWMSAELKFQFIRQRDQSTGQSAKGCDTKSCARDGNDEKE